MNEGSTVDDRQVFVRNLAYDATEDDLAAIFEPLGPLKHTSIAMDPQGKPRGFGFVKFALAEDAATALQQLQGNLLKGRALKLELGVKKENRRSRAAKQQSLPAAGEEPSPSCADENQEESAIAGYEDGDEVAEVQPTLPKEADAKVPSDADAPATAAGDETTAVKSRRQVVVFGVPAELSKQDFKLLLGKAVRDAEVELLKEVPFNHTYRTVKSTSMHSGGACIDVVLMINY